MNGLASLTNPHYVSCLMNLGFDQNYIAENSLMVLQQVVGLELDLTHMKLLQRVMRKVQQVQQPKPPGTFHHTVPAIGHTGFAIAAIAASSPEHHQQLERHWHLRMHGNLQKGQLSQLCCGSYIQLIVSLLPRPTVGSNYVPSWWGA